ncbi:MAG: MmgE/PrpD family protein [Burkholderiales bacterium]
MVSCVRDRLAQFVHSITYSALPSEVVHEAKRYVLDTLGCALGAYRSEPAAITQRVARVLGGAAEASVIGSGWKTSAPLATLVNGTLIRYLDSNDYYFGSDSAHPSSNIPPALALSQRLGRDGKDLITAIVIGYEVQMRLCDAVADPGISGRGWHTATHVQFSTAALAARLLSDDPKVTANALSIAGSHHNTLAEAQRGDIPLMKATAEAYVAKGAVEAALLAAEGLTGPAHIFEGTAGWEKTVAGAIDYEILLRGLDGDYRIMRSCIKPYPAVAGAMAPIQAAVDLGVDRTRIGDIEAITVKLPRVTAKKASGDPKKLHPKDKETADHSIHYCVAVTLIDGECGRKQFSDEMIASPIVADLIRKIRIEEDARLTSLYPSSSGGSVAVRLRGGHELQKTHRYPPGHPRNRVSDADIERKFFDMADGVLARNAAQQVIESIWALDVCDTLETVFTPLAVR